jgi:hypothetical protein
MNSEVPRGRREVAFRGESRAEYEGELETDETLVKSATLEEALQDLAAQALADGYENIRVASIAIRGGNPHIKEVSVVGTPGE